MTARRQVQGAGKVSWTPVLAALAWCLQGIVSSGQEQAGGSLEAQQKIDGFNSAMESAFPMTPGMVRRYRESYEENERAMMETPEPEPIMDMDIVSLEPGGPVPVLNVSPGIVSVVGFHDATGKPWPVRQYVVGNGESFNVLQLGENSNSLAVSSLVRVGWTNLVVALAEEPTAVVLRVNVNRKRAHFRRSIQVMKPGPLSDPNFASEVPEFPRPGDSALMSVLTGAAPSADAQAVSVEGLQASAWIAGDALYVRTRHPLLSPPWEASLSGPDGLRAYRLQSSPVLLFSRHGRIVRAEMELP